jgi:hypothetical protein
MIMVDKTELIVGVNTNEVKEGTKDLSNFEKTGKKTQSSVVQLEKATEKLNADFAMQARNAGKSANEIKILDLKAKGATTAQLDAARAAMKNAEAMKKQADAARFASQSAGETNGAFRAMRGSTQQLSWQLQDVAVQAQMGTSAFTILGQQGPQIASIFGSGGAVLGALVAFGAILAGAVYRSLTGTGEAMKKLKTINESLIESFDDLTNAQKDYARSLALKEIKENEQAITDLEDAQDRQTKQVLRGSFAYKEFSESLDNYNDRLEKNKSDVDSLKTKNKDLAASVDDLTDNTESLLKSLGEELSTLNLTEEQLFAYELAMSGATKKQIALGVATFNKLQKDKEALEAIKDSEAAVKKQTEETQNYTISLNHQLVSLSLSGDALFLYQASLKGGTLEQIKANAALLKSIALFKLKAKADEDFAKNEAAMAIVIAQLNAKADAEREKEQERATKLAAKAAQRGLEKIEILKAQHEAERIQLAADLANELITQQAHDEALKGQARETAAALAEIDKKSAEDKQAITDAKLQIDQQLLSSASGIVSQLAGIAEEGSREAKILFGIEKGIAVATTIINAHVAAQQAMTALPYPMNVAASNMILGMGYASAGVIAGTAIAGGRALGGQVRGGQSYLVGERGPELLTMGTSGRIATNESLKNAVGGDNNNTSNVVNVNFSVQANDTAGFDRLLQSRRGQIVGMINQAVNNRGRASIV